MAQTQKSLGANEETLGLLGEIYSAEGRERTLAENAALALGSGLRQLQAEVGFIATVTADEVVEVIRVTRQSTKFVRLAFPIDAPYPLAVALRRGDELILGSNAQVACDHPGLVRLETRDHACITIPLRDRAESIVGAMNVTFEEPRTFTDVDCAQVRAVAAFCAAAMA